MEAEAPMAARVLVGRYRMGPLLGTGGMAEVYDGYDERLHRNVAVKVLRPEAAADPDIRERFEVEARSAARLSHPNVVAVFDTGEDGGTPFIVMERLGGETLADRMAGGPVDQVWLRRVAGDVLAALGAAHAAGIVHRDVKPGNILIGDDGCAKVADFGIAKSKEVGADITGTGLLVGTPAYLAPERLHGKAATPQSDLYSLGVVLYEALAGAKPYDGDTPVGVADAVLHSRHVPLPERRADVDPAMAGAVEQAMARDPKARPASARAMGRLLAVAPVPAGADPTVGLTTEHGADPTLVGVPVPMDPFPADEAGRPPRAGSGRHPSPAVRRVALAVAAVVVFVLLAGLARSGRGGDVRDDAQTARIRDLATRVEVGDGPSGPEASARLKEIADQVAAGGGADEANALLADAALWQQAGSLSATAASQIVSTLSEIAGVDPALATTTVAPTTVPADEQGDEDQLPRGKGKKHRGSD